MLSPLRNRFGIPGVISVIALVFAMLGGAYAASNDGGGKATASAKAKRGPKGPKGATGPAGPAGPQGPAGAKGDTGAAGSNGKDGTDGAAGKDGKGVETASFAGTKGSCLEGGIEVKSASPTVNVCNGKKGADGAPGAAGAPGPQGSPWTAGGTLPSGKTEKGVWSMQLGAEFAPGFREAQSPISFVIPLASKLAAANVQVNAAGFNGEDEAAGEHENCPGHMVNPKAKAGFLCVYTQVKNYTSLGVLVDSETGAGVVLQDISTDAQGKFAWGTWAVTAP